MKFKLMILSLSPLAFLTIIRNFLFVTKDSNNQGLNIIGFLKENLILIVVISVCVIWIIAALIFYINFAAFKWNDKNGGYSVCNISENETASLNFFLTLIVPLLLDDVNTLKGALTLLFLVTMICVLIYKTNLFYANPVLSVLGYRVYEFSFQENNEYGKKPYIGLCLGTVKENQVIEYKKISKKVFYIKGI